MNWDKVFVFCGGVAAGCFMVLFIREFGLWGWIPGLSLSFFIGWVAARVE